MPSPAVAALLRSGKIVLMISATIPDIHMHVQVGVVNPSSSIRKVHPVVGNRVSFCPFLPSCSQVPYWPKLWQV